MRVSLEFHEGVLQDAPTHDGFRPIEHLRQEFKADEQLDYLDLMLDDMLQRWQQALRANLTSETTQHSLAAMNPEERRPIDQFLAQSDSDTHLPQAFVQAANHALQGIEAIALSVEEMVNNLKKGGLPCTVAELERRFQTFVQAAMHGHDARNTRLTLDE